MTQRSQVAPGILKELAAAAKSMERSSCAETIASAIATLVWRPGFMTESCTFQRRTRNNSRSIAKEAVGVSRDERKAGRNEGETSAALNSKVFAAIAEPSDTY